MTKLHTLRSQLASLRRQRQWFRWCTGYAGLLIALLGILAVVFVLDFAFNLDTPQRAVVMLIGLGGLVWAALRFTSPFLGIAETETDMALLVERQQGIDSDLVAALQFESPEAAKWGSRELEGAVIDYVAQLDRELDVFEGFSRKQMWTRLGVLGASLLLAAILIINPLTGPYAHAFFLRLTLDNVHYPSDTSIDRVFVNGREVLQQQRHGALPLETKSAQSQGVAFAALVSGDLPQDGAATIEPLGHGSKRDVDLTKVTRREIEDAVDLIGRQLCPVKPADFETLNNLSPQRRSELATLISTVTQIDRARAATAIENPHDESLELATTVGRLQALLNKWPADAGVQLYVGKLPRLSDPVKYTIKLGDAYTDKALIGMIDLPVVEADIDVVPPQYARHADDARQDRRSLQRSVIEGSQVHLAIGSSKPLEKATLAIIDTAAGERTRTEQPLEKVKGQAENTWTTRDGESSPAEVWRLAEATQLAQVKGALRFEIQVVDTDGLSLEAPLRGNIRLKADRPPRINGSLVHRVVLPTATPEIELRADDDYGIAAMQVNVSVVRGEFSKLNTENQSNEASFAIDELYELRRNPTAEFDGTNSRKLDGFRYPVLGSALPVVGAYKLNLSPLNLVRGDQLRIVLAATDYRGAPGVVGESEPIILEITDESGILAAIAEGDRRGQEQIDDLIRRQLGIGEAP